MINDSDISIFVPCICTTMGAGIYFIEYIFSLDIHQFLIDMCTERHEISDVSPIEMYLL